MEGLSPTDEFIDKSSTDTRASVQRLDDESSKLDFALNRIHPDFTVGNWFSQAEKNVGPHVWILAPRLWQFNSKPRPKKIADHTA